MLHKGERVLNNNVIPHKVSTIDKYDVLHELLNYDIMSPDVLEVIRTLKIEKVLQMHPYAITKPKDENGRWQTYVNTENGRKKIIGTC